MARFEFYKNEKAGNEDWYALVVDAGSTRITVEHSWSYMRGNDGTKSYTLEEFQAQEPSYFRMLVEKLARRLDATA